MGGKARFAAALAAAPVLFLAFLVILLGGSSTSAAACDQVVADLRGEAMAGLDADQRKVAGLIVAAVRAFPPTANQPRAAVVALATARQESSLRNLDYGDRDSLGVFQQRPSQGWGTPAEVMNVAHATTTFLRHLIDLPQWGTRPVTEVAADVQRPAEHLRDAYEQWVPLATSLTRQMWTQSVSLVPGSTDCHSIGGGGAPMQPGAAGAVARAQSWVDARVPYSQASYHSNEYGSYRQDCSGYVSLVWGLATSFTTYSLPSIAHRITKNELRAGDIMLRPGHTLIFHKWANAERTRYWAYEQQRPGRVATHYVVPYPYWAGHGAFSPYRQD